MKITELFTILKDNIDEDNAIDTYLLIESVKSILKVRVDLDIRNDIVDLYMNREAVISYLINDVPDIATSLSTIFDIEDISEYIADNKGSNGTFTDDEDDEDNVVQVHVSQTVSLMVIAALIMSGLNLFLAVGLTSVAF